MDEKDRLDEITRRVIGAAIDVHKILRPGLLESAYEACLAYELRQLGYKIEQQKPLPVTYKDVRLDCGYRLDFAVEDSVIVEVKGHRTSGANSRRTINFVFTSCRQKRGIADKYPRAAAKEWCQENRE